MNCQRAEELLSQLPDGDLTRAQREQVSAHLIVCAACRQAEEQHRRLTHLAHRWVPRATPTETAADVFTAQVLARIGQRRKSAYYSLWLPAVAASLGIAALALLPHALWPVLPDFAGAAQSLPGWLLAAVHALPADTLAVWQSAQGISFSAQWLGSLLAGACLLNLVFYARAVQSRLKGSRS